MCNTVTFSNWLIAWCVSIVEPFNQPRVFVYVGECFYYFAYVNIVLPTILLYSKNSISYISCYSWILYCKSLIEWTFFSRNYKCDKCHLVFPNESLHKIHIILHNQVTNDDSVDNTDIICPSCHRKYPTQRHLILHVSSHSLPKYKMIPESFQCPVCYTSYPLRERLQVSILFSLQKIICHVKKPLILKLIHWTFRSKWSILST